MTSRDWLCLLLAVSLLSFAVGVDYGREHGPRLSVAGAVR